MTIFERHTALILPSPVLEEVIDSRRRLVMKHLPHCSCLWIFFVGCIKVSPTAEASSEASGGWFSSRRPLRRNPDEIQEEFSNPFERNGNKERNFNNEQPPPPPGRWSDDNGSWRPPPPPDPTSQQSSSSASYTPIHYQFPSREESQRKDRFREYDDDVPRTADLEEETQYNRRRRDDERDLPKYASPRRDPVTRYMSSGSRQKALLILSAGAVGAGAGGFIGKSTLNVPKFMALICFAVSAFGAAVLRNPYGELLRTLGLTLIWALQRTGSIRRQYPTWPLVKACLALAPRRPFPPRRDGNASLWQYQPERPEDPEFRMLFCLVAVAFCGTLCGGNIPLVPSWIGALCGAGFFAALCTVDNSRGDLVRSMGMRVVSLAEEVIGINSELGVLRKSGVVAGLVFDKMMILDRKHRIKDRLVSAFSWAYEKASRTAVEMQDARQQPRRRGGGGRGRREPPRGEREPPKRDRDFSRREGEEGPRPRHVEEPDLAMRGDDPRNDKEVAPSGYEERWR